MRSIFFRATYEAMREAVSKLEPVPQILLNDAVTIPDVTIPQVPIIKKGMPRVFPLQLPAL